MDVRISLPATTTPPFRLRPTLVIHPPRTTICIERQAPRTAKRGSAPLARRICRVRRPTDQIPKLTQRRARRWAAQGRAAWRGGADRGRAGALARGARRIFPRRQSGYFGEIAGETPVVAALTAGARPSTRRAGPLGAGPAIGMNHAERRARVVHALGERQC